MRSKVSLEFLIGNKIDYTFTAQVENAELLPGNNKIKKFQFSNISWPDFLLNVYDENFQKPFFGTCILKVVHSLSSFLKLRKKDSATSSTGRHYFRGQSAGSLVLPSILRSKKYLNNEKDMFNEMLEAFSNQFKDINSDFDKLALMRSNGMPARILDLSTNPLVALYHACKRCSKDIPLGMVIDFKLDGCIEERSSQDMNNKNDFFSFSDKSPVIVRPSCFNAQVANQQTVYLLFKNSAKGFVGKVCEFNKEHIEKNVYLIHHTNAQAILEELAAIGIDDYQMNPDIESLTKSVANKFSSKTEDKKRVKQEDYLLELSDAFIDRGYVPISQFFRRKGTGLWILCDSNPEPSDKQSTRLNEAENSFNSVNMGMIKLILKGKPKNKPHVFTWDDKTEGFRKQLENTIKAQLQKRIRILEDNEIQFHNTQADCKAEIHIPENDANQFGELYRRDGEISRILRRIDHEKLRLRSLENQMEISLFPGESDLKKCSNWPASILYDQARIKPIYVESAFNFLSELTSFKNEQKAILLPYNIYFRGQALQYPINASLFRNENHVKHEKDMYAELLARLPETFNKEPSIFDRLVVMKHYEFPSRLLDITENPLVALLFACLNNTRKMNPHHFSLQAVHMCFSNKEEEKDILSDTVVRLCALPLAKNGEFSDDEFDESAFLNEIKYRSQRYAPGYYPISPCLEELDKTILVHPSMNNKRVERQKGAFLISGRNNENPTLQNIDVKGFFLPNHSLPIPLFVVLENSSVKILDELKQHFGLDESFIYPEMQYKAKEIRERYR